MTYPTHEITNNLPVRFPIVPIRRIAPRPEYVLERTTHRAATSSLAAQKSAVDVEENNPHDLVKNTPVMIVAVPRPCHSVGISPSVIHATISAIIGCTFAYTAVRVGPSTRTPRYQNR